MVDALSLPVGSVALTWHVPQTGLVLLGNAAILKSHLWEMIRF